MIFSFSNACSEPEKNAGNGGFPTELAGFRNLMESAYLSLLESGKSGVEMEEAIDSSCRRYLDILVPIMSEFPELFEQLKKERPSLGPWLTERRDEYLGKKFSLRDVEAAFKEAEASAPRITQPPDQKLDLNHFFAIQILVHKFGFSPHLFRAAGIRGQDYAECLFRLYDMRLKETQVVGNIDVSRVKTRLCFRKRRVSEEELQMLRALARKVCPSDAALPSPAWVIDPKEEHFLAALWGGYFGDERKNWTFAYGCGQEIVRIEAAYSQPASCADGYEVCWHIHELQIPRSLREEETSLLSDIRDAFKVFSIGLYVLSAQVSLECEPVFFD